MSPKCGFCNGTSFKLAQPFGDVQGAKFKMPFVVCSTCNAAVAVMSQHDAGIAAAEAGRKIDLLQKEVHGLASDIHQIKQALARR